jgi:hypothetical protein
VWADNGHVCVCVYCLAELFHYPAAPPPPPPNRFTVSRLQGLYPLGLATEYRSEKFPRNRLGMGSVIPRKKVLIPRHSEVYGRVNYEARNGKKWLEKN